MAVDIKSGSTVRRDLVFGWATLGLLVAVDMYLRFHRLSWASLWSDELFTVAAAMDVGHGGWWLAFKAKVIPELTVNDSFLTWKAADNTPPLYELLLIGWSKLFGDSDLALRSLSATIGGMAPLVFFGGLRRSLGAMPAFLGAILYVFSPSAIIYSQEVRAYTLTSLLATAATVRLVDRTLSAGQWEAEPPNWRRSLWVDIAIYILLAYSHYTGLFLAGLLAGIYCLLVAIPRRRFREVLQFLLVPLALLPWILLSRKAFVYANEGGLGWRDYEVHEIWSHMVPGMLDFFLAGAGGVLVAVFLVTFLVASPLAGERGMAKEQDIASDSDTRKLILVSGFVLCICLLFAYSAYNAFHAKMWHSRYFSAALPLVFAAFAVLFSCTRLTRWVAAGITVILLGAGLPALLSYYQSGWANKEQYREAARYVAEVARPSDSIILGWRPNAAFYIHYLSKYLANERESVEIDSVSTKDDVDRMCARGWKSGHQVILFQHRSQSPYGDWLKQCPQFQSSEIKVFQGVLVEVFRTR